MTAKLAKDEQKELKDAESDIDESGDESDEDMMI